MHNFQNNCIYHINPDKEILMPEDVLVARGTGEGLEKLGKVASGEADSLE